MVIKLGEGRWAASHPQSQSVGPQLFLADRSSDKHLLRLYHRSIYKYLDTGLQSLSIDKMRAPQTDLSCPACIASGNFILEFPSINSRSRLFSRWRMRASPRGLWSRRQVWLWRMRQRDACWAGEVSLKGSPIATMRDSSPVSRYLYIDLWYEHTAAVTHHISSVLRPTTHRTEITQRLQTEIRCKQSKNCRDSKKTIMSKPRTRL